MTKLALSCILGNALPHGSDMVEVCSLAGPDGLSFELRDNGDALEECQLGVLMSPFQTGLDVNTRKTGSVGLGLPLTKCLVEMQSGELEIDRRDGWTVVTVKLPKWRTEIAAVEPERDS
ncbi:ATP-binding protein [Sagittula stellata]|uniref:histidine kinase n=1 Tax=Sagittula stellata (strain ATCC 700073 / DSM 11524 / E-37) TaxID=388399 RepID=A3K4Q4_SAGS3|nr:ATP-binding protein [Sagittula stellata]EBA07953.1 Signal transduction histidine kinase [Sagittula stellata E-37]